MNQKWILVGALLVSSAVFAKDKKETRKPSQASTAKCHLSGEELPFQVVDGDDAADKGEYRTIERFVRGARVFRLRVGHGVQRLEVYESGTLTAATFRSENDGNSKSGLNLETGKLQVFCENLDKE